MNKLSKAKIIDEKEKMRGLPLSMQSRKAENHRYGHRQAFKLSFAKAMDKMKNKKKKQKNKDKSPASFACGTFI